MEGNTNTNIGAANKQNVLCINDIGMIDNIPVMETQKAIGVNQSETNKRHAKMGSINPLNIISTRRDYFTIPSINEINKQTSTNSNCVIKELIICCTEYGSLYFPGEVRVIRLNLDATVLFRHKEITVYPDDYADKPSFGEELNRPAIVTLYNVFPTLFGKEVRDCRAIADFEYITKLKESCTRQGCRFLEYNCVKGTWVFQVEHFSKYGVDFDDEVDISGSDNHSRTEKRSAAEDKPPAVEPKKAVVRSDEKFESQEIIEVRHGLGGQDYTQNRKKIMETSLTYGRHGYMHGGHEYIQDGTSVLDLSTKVYRDELVPKRHMELMRHALYDTAQDIRRYSPSYMYNMMERDVVTNLRESCVLEQPLYVDQITPVRKPMYGAPTICVLQNVSGKVPSENSLLKGLRCYKDINIFKGESFRCGWMKGFKHITLSNEIYLGRHSSSILHIRDVTVSCELVDEFTTLALNMVHSETTHETDHHGCPTFNMKTGSSYLIRQTELFHKLIDCPGNNENMKYFSSIWQLCYALWAPLLDEKDLRKDYVSKWLRQTVDKQVVHPWLTGHEQNMSFEKLISIVLELLSINNVQDAAEVLMLNKFPQLSLLVSQLSGTNNFQNLLSEQLIFWYNSMAEEFIPVEMKKIYLLMSGNAMFGEVNICENLDWKRAFGMHLWYVAPSHAPLHEVARIYKDAFDGENVYAAKPLPPYASVNTESDTFDILYHILMLSCSRVYLLNHVLDPATHTEDPLDYRMSWLLLQLFKSLEVGVIDEMSENMLTLSFAHQLENMNEWQWAVFVLLFLKDNILKKQHIIGILERNLTLSVNKETDAIDDTLVNKMKVPSKWIHEVKAYKAVHQQLHWLAYAHFAHAGNYYKSNDIFVTHLLPDLVVNESFNTLKQAVVVLLPYKNQILSWCYEIGLVLDFLQLHEKFETAEGENDLLKLHTALVTLVKRLPQFPLNNNLQKLCIAEISRKCALLQRLLVERVTDPSFKHSFIQVMDHLVMPPDYVFSEGLYYFLKLMD